MAGSRSVLDRLLKVWGWASTVHLAISGSGWPARSWLMTCFHGMYFFGMYTQFLLPFRRLQARHSGRRLPHELSPPCERGMMCPTVIGLFESPHGNEQAPLARQISEPHWPVHAHRRRCFLMYRA